jgi:hypothetical protein
MNAPDVRQGLIKLGFLIIPWILNYKKIIMKNKISLSILSLAVLLSCKNSQLTNTAADTKSVSVKLTDNQLMDKVQSDALKYFGTLLNPIHS